MKASQLRSLGVPNHLICVVHDCIHRAASIGKDVRNSREAIQSILLDPESFIGDDCFGSLVQALLSDRDIIQSLNKDPIEFKQWGRDIDPQAIVQMQTACRLPISRFAALMPDAHLGYGVPIGSVLATEGAVIPNAVGVDIACRMKITVLDISHTAIEARSDDLRRALQNETCFGAGQVFKTPRKHDILDDPRWKTTRLLRGLIDKASSQVGTSGGGNHFVEFGVLEVPQYSQDIGLSSGKYLALLSHSGSRGVGATVAKHYCDLAQDIQPGPLREFHDLAWLDMNSGPGQEYWDAMNLCGAYASACHDVIHRSVLKSLGAQPIVSVSNHHNFAWKESHFGKEVVVHRKGATPADKNVLGVIPGSMADPAYIVRGLGSPESLSSASHGAGRKMSRRQAKQNIVMADAYKYLSDRNVTLLSGGLDEMPMAYKNIEEVMQAQTDLVVPIAKFQPRIVRMADDGSKED